jgi:hypothetical protein
MSVVGVAVMQRRPMRGYDDPGLPERIWQGQGTVIGDGSGGTRFVSFPLNQAPFERRGTSWSLERIYITMTDTVAKFLRVVPQSLDRFVGVADESLQRAFVVEVERAATGVQIRLEHTQPGAYFGQAAGLGGATSIAVEAVNADLAILNVVLEGYEWGPRSVLAPNGIRRPVDGLYRT